MTPRVTAHGWAIQAPKWGHPPPWLNTNTVRTTRAAAIDAWCTALGVTRAGGGWERLYRKGWRCVRVTVVEGSPLLGLDGLRAVVARWKREADEGIKITDNGTALYNFCGGKSAALQAVLYEIDRLEAGTLDAPPGAGAS